MENSNHRAAPASMPAQRVGHALLGQRRGEAHVKAAIDPSPLHGRRSGPEVQRWCAARLETVGHQFAGVAKMAPCWAGSPLFSSPVHHCPKCFAAPAAQAFGLFLFVISEAGG